MGIPVTGEEKAEVRLARYASARIDVDAARGRLNRAQAAHDGAARSAGLEFKRAQAVHDEAVQYAGTELDRALAAYNEAIQSARTELGNAHSEMQKAVKHARQAHDQLVSVIPPPPEG